MAKRSAAQAVPPRLIITCEHAGNRVPRGGGMAGVIPRAILESHRAYDPGTLALTHSLANALGAPAHVHLITRLVVDTNRSEDNPDLFSRFSAHMPATARSALVRHYYKPFRAAVLRDIRRLLRAGPPNSRPPRLVHVSVHSFTPILRGVKRTVDIGILFDPTRAAERALAERWIAELRRLEPRLRVEPNEPYHGASDGHTTALRSEFSSRDYAGIELELNQRLVRDALRSEAGALRLARIHSSIAASLAAALVGNPQKTAKIGHLSTNSQKSR